MTRTQLKGLTTRQLIERARQTAEPLFTDGDMILELADRLDDCYVFNHDTPDPQQQELQA